MNIHLNFLIIFLLFTFIYCASAKSSISKLPECVKNSTNLGLFKPYFKTKKICKEKGSFYTLIPFGHQFEFDCTYDSNPPSRILWFKHGEIKNQTDLIESLNNSVRLTIRKISLNDSGFYTCTIINSLGSISHTFQLDVSDLPLAPPIFNHKEEQIAAEKGVNVSLDCTYKTDEFSSLVFYRANNFNNHTFEQLTTLNDAEARAESVLHLIDSSRTFDLLNLSSNSNYSLMIENLTEEKYGTYMCIAKNRYGQSLKFIKLTEKKIEANFIIQFCIILLGFIIMIIFFNLKAHLRLNDKERFMIEKSYIIKKKIIIDYFAGKHGLISTDGNQLTSSINPNCDFELNSYKNFPVFPRVEIVKERKEIVGKKLSEELNNNEDFFEIDLDHRWEIDRNCLRLDKIIGQGNFGIVQRAFLFDLPAPVLEESKPIYVNNSTCEKVCQINAESQNYTSAEYTNISKLNYNYIIDHFHNNNLNNTATAFSNNYYGLQDLIGNYGHIDLFLKMDNKNSQREKNCRMVAVKKLKDDYSENDVKDFISEMVMMKLYGNHKNIINLIGTCTQDGPFYVIMEYAEKGNLKDFLKNYRINNYYLSSAIEHKYLTTRDLISFALQIAQGMHHLARLHCIHRDLAARNVLVTSNLQMKVADFGLSRNTGDSEYYRKSSDSFVPIKWLAPECISQQLYTVQTDVWSYAVTMWELTSLGCSPYENLDPQDMFLYLKAGKRMDKPLWCNENVYNLMLKCWNWNPRERPLFDKIIQCLDLLFQSETPNNYVICSDLSRKNSINFGSQYIKSSR